MIDTARKLHNWFLALSKRERWLIGIAAILATFVIGFYLVTQPMLNAIDAKRAEYFVALERRAAIVSQVRSALNEKVGTDSIPAGSVQQLISQSAVDAGFILDRADASGTDEVEIAMAKAKPAAFMVWLGDWETRGILARNLDVKASADGTIAVTATLARQAQ